MLAIGIQSKRERWLAVVTGIVIFGAAIFAIVIRPHLSRRHQNIQHLQELRLKLAKMKADVMLKDKIDSLYSDIEPLITSQNTDQREISLLARQVGELHANLNVKIRSMRILPITQEQFYKRLAVRIEMAGHLRDVLNFISSVETCQNPLRIERLELTAQEIADHVQATFVITKVTAKPSA